MDRPRVFLTRMLSLICPLRKAATHKIPRSDQIFWLLWLDNFQPTKAKFLNFVGVCQAFNHTHVMGLLKTFLQKIPNHAFQQLMRLNQHLHSARCSNQGTGNKAFPFTLSVTTAKGTSWMHHQFRPVTFTTATRFTLNLYSFLQLLSCDMI